METPLRVLPHNIQAEQTVLGCMIKDKTSIAQSAEALRGEDFYRESHQIIFNAIYELYSKDIPVDKIGRSTRLNSSHANISYAVFCLKKKNKNKYLSFM